MEIWFSCMSSVICFWDTYLCDILSLHKNYGWKKTHVCEYLWNYYRIEINTNLHKFCPSLISSLNCWEKWIKSVLANSENVDFMNTSHAPYPYGYIYSVFIDFTNFHPFSDIFRKWFWILIRNNVADNGKLLPFWNLNALLCCLLMEKDGVWKELLF